MGGWRRTTVAVMVTALVTAGMSWAGAWLIWGRDSDSAAPRFPLQGPYSAAVGKACDLMPAEELNKNIPEPIGALQWTVKEPDQPSPTGVPSCEATSADGQKVIQIH